MKVQLADSGPYLKMPDGAGGFISVREDLLDGLPDQQWNLLMQEIAYLNTPKELNGPFSFVKDFISERQQRRQDRKDKRLDARIDRRGGTREAKDQRIYSQAAGIIKTPGEIWAGALPGIIGATGQTAGQIGGLIAGVPGMGGMMGGLPGIPPGASRNTITPPHAQNNQLLLLAGLGLAAYFILNKK